VRSPIHINRAVPAVMTALAVVAAARGRSSSDEAVAERASATTTTAAPGVTDATDEAVHSYEDLVGRYAHFDAVAYEDDLMKTVIISFGFADLELRDGELWNQMTFCRADTVTDQAIEISISDAATSAIEPVATPVEVSGEEGNRRVVRPPTPTAIGIDLADPANEALPTDPDDPRIIDADGDGNPGVTSRVTVTEDLEGEIYLARREIFAYDVTQQAPDRLVGTITDDSEQLIIGASDPVFLTPAQWVQVDDPDRNPVVWQRVDDHWDCDQLADQRDELFPPNPAADW
jgi:hypothetical protein